MLNLSTYGNAASWSQNSNTFTFPLDVAVSTSAQYILLIDANANAIFSRNSGLTFSSTSTGAFASQACALSTSGQYSAVACSGGANGVLISSNFNTSYSGYLPGISGVAVCMSAAGKYMYLANSSTNIYASNNYGVSWIVISNTGATDNIGNGNTNNKVIACSSSGQIVSFFSTATGKIFVSQDYASTWTSTTGLIGTSSFIGMSMSGSGQYQLAISNNNQIFLSTDFGFTWIRQASGTTFSGLLSPSVSAAGQYMAISTNTTNVYTSSDYGSTWTSSVIGSTNGFTNVAVISDGSHIYGTSYSSSGLNLYKSTNI